MKLQSHVLASAVALFAFFSRPVSASNYGGHIMLCNFTPYDWKRNYVHSYQLTWEAPEMVRTGTCEKQYIEWKKIMAVGQDGKDDAAEAVYELVGSPLPASFTLQAHNRDRGQHIQVQYHDHLSSVATLFALAGDGQTPYTGSNPPVNWMQATLPTIGGKNLRQISMPATHNSGMSELHEPNHFAVPHNTQCQIANVYEQLRFGARWLDIRPLHARGRWMTSHVSRFGTEDRRFAGSAGRSLDDVIDDMNRFTAQNPGELIFVDLSHEIKRTQEFAGIRDLEEHDWTELYDKLSRIGHLWNPSDEIFNNLPHDLSTVPISTFIQPGSSSAVLIRVPGHAPQTSLKAVIHDRRIPYGGRWSDTMDAGFLEQDQVRQLQESRPSRDSEMHRSIYTITQSGTAISHVAQPEQSIIGLSRQAHKKLFLELWPHMSRNTYPNIIEIDNIHNSNVAAMCMVINEHFAK